MALGTLMTRTISLSSPAVTARVVAKHAPATVVSQAASTPASPGVNDAVGRAGSPAVTGYTAVPLVLTGLFSLYLQVWFLEFGLRVKWLGAIRFEFILGAVLVVVAALWIASRGGSNASRLTKYICAYFVFLLGHLALSEYFDVSWASFVDWIVKFACITLFTFAFVKSPRTLRIFMAMLLLAFFKIGLDAFVGKITGGMVWQSQGIMRLWGEPGSRFGHPNSLSGFAVSMTPFLYYLFPVVQRKWKACLLVLLVFTVNIIVFTGSRTGYLGAIAFAGFLWLRSHKKNRFLVILVLIAVVGVQFVPQQYQGRFMSAFVGEEVEGHSKALRLELARDAWALFVENPQGLGINTFMLARFHKLHKAPYDTHNLYLQILADLGVGGAVVFSLLVFSLLSELHQADRALARDEQQLHALLKETGAKPPSWMPQHLADVRFMRATTSAFLAFVVMRLFLGFFGHDLYEVYWWLAAGASMAIVNMYPVARARTAEIVKHRIVPSPVTRVRFAAPHPA